MYIEIMLILTIREFIVCNFFYRLLGFVYNNKVYDNFLLCLLFNLIPFYFLNMVCAYFGLSLVYRVDDIVNYTYNNKLEILPRIKNIYIDNNDKTDIFKKYSSNVPLFIINKLENNVFNDSSKITFLLKKRRNDEIIVFDYSRVKNNSKSEILTLDMSSTVNHS